MAQLLVSPISIPSTYYQAVGFVLHQWALLEFYLEQINCILLNRLGPKEGRLLFSQLNARPKIEVFKALVNKKITDAETKRMADFIGKHAAKLSELRNKIVHGRWSHPIGKPRTIILYYVGGSSDNRWMPKPFKAKSRSVTQIGNMIRTLNVMADHVVSRLNAPHRLQNEFSSESPQEDPLANETP